MSYVMGEEVVTKCSVKHVFHHNAVVTDLKYCCKQCNNVDMA